MRARLTLWNVSVIATVLVALAATLKVMVENEVMASIDRELQDRAVSGLQSRPPFENPLSTRNSASGRLAAATSSHFLPRYFNRRGLPLKTSPSRRPWDIDAMWIAVGGARTYSNVESDEEPYRVYTAPLRAHGRIVGAFQVALPIGGIERGFEGLTRVLWILAPVALLVAGAGGAFLTDRALRPVREIARTAEHVGTNNLGERLRVVGKDEFSSLSSTINGMLSRLEEGFSRQAQLFEQQRRFTADASHELRTPLTVIKANSSLALSRGETIAEFRRAIEATDHAADQMTRIVQDLLLLARSDAGQLRLRLHAFPIGQIVEQAADSFRSEQSPAIMVDLCDPSSAVLGDESYLVRLFVNLLENAVRVSDPSGTVHVHARCTGLNLIVTVTDSGPGIAPEHLPHIFERFYRVDMARSKSAGGTGLGLSICQSIVEAHHGSISVESEPGVGTEVHVVLPRAGSAETAEMLQQIGGDA